jgi:hypothetical protein
MRKLFWIMGLASALSFATVASATTYTWSFGSNPKTVADNTTYSGTNSGGSITVFSEQITNDVNGGSFFSANNSTVSGLFSTNDSVFDEGIGIAPYDPQEGGSPFSVQDGITDSANGSSTKGNLLVLELGSNIATGTTLQFLIQAGIGASSDVVSDYWSTTVSGPNVSPDAMTLNGTTTAGQISTNGTTPQSALTITKKAGIEWVAIEADCHYILLDTITGTPGTSTPEPRFYGLLLAGLLGVAGTLYQRRRAAQANA